MDCSPPDCGCSDPCTSVNAKITDSVTQANLKVIGDAPAMAMGGLFQSASHALGITLQASANALAQHFMTSQAASVIGVSMLYAVDTAATASAEQTIDSTSLAKLITMLNAVVPPASSSSTTA